MTFPGICPRWVVPLSLNWSPPMSPTRFRFLVTAALLAAGSGSARADFTYVNFASTAGLQLNGNTTTAGNELRLTSSAPFQSGSAFTTTAVGLAANYSFSTHFKFRITRNAGIGDGDGTGADGLVFVIQTVSNNVGGAGGGIGYAGINNSLGIEFDTYDNGAGAGDPNGNHVGIDLNGSVNSVATALEPTRFNNGQIWDVWVDYNGATNGLEVRWSNTGVRPGAA